MKKILITGCSTGFGFDSAKYFAEKGHHVFATMRNINGKNAEAETVLSFQTLPDPPTVVYTYPVKLGKQLPLNTPVAVEFSTHAARPLFRLQLPLYFPIARRRAGPHVGFLKFN